MGTLKVILTPAETITLVVTSDDREVHMNIGTRENSGRLGRLLVSAGRNWVGGVVLNLDNGLSMSLNRASDAVTIGNMLIAGENA